MSALRDAHLTMRTCCATTPRDRKVSSDRTHSSRSKSQFGSNSLLEDEKSVRTRGTPSSLLENEKSVRWT